MRIIIACCVAVLLTLPLGAQDTAPSTGGPTTSIVQVAGTVASFAIAAPIHEHRFESIRMQPSRGFDSTNHSRTVAGTAKSSASGYVIGGAIIGAVAGSWSCPLPQRDSRRIRRQPDRFRSSLRCVCRDRCRHRIHSVPRSPLNLFIARRIKRVGTALEIDVHCMYFAEWTIFASTGIRQRLG